MPESISSALATPSASTKDGSLIIDTRILVDHELRGGLIPIGNFSERSVSASFRNRYSLYAYYPSRHHMPAKTRAFLDLVVELTTSNNQRVGAS